MVDAAWSEFYGLVMAIDIATTLDDQRLTIAAQGDRIDQLEAERDILIVSERESTRVFDALLKQYESLADSTSINPTDAAKYHERREALTELREIGGYPSTAVDRILAKLYHEYWTASKSPETEDEKRMYEWKTRAVGEAIRRIEKELRG